MLKMVVKFLPLTSLVFSIGVFVFSFQTNRTIRSRAAMAIEYQKQAEIDNARYRQCTLSGGWYGSGADPQCSCPDGAINGKLFGAPDICVMTVLE